MTKFSESHSGLMPFDLQLKDTLIGLGLVQVIDHPTRVTDTTANLRDLVMTSNTERILDSGLLSPFPHIDHIPTYISVKCTPPDTKISRLHLWDYKKMNIKLFVDLLMHDDWDEIMNRDVNKATEMLTRTILEAAQKSIPQSIIRLHGRDKPWVTQVLKIEIARRNRLFKRAKSTETQRSWTLWKLQRNKVTELNKNLKATNVRKQVHKLTECKHDPRRYHRLLKNILSTSRKTASSIPPLENNGSGPLTMSVKLTF